MAFWQLQVRVRAVHAVCVMCVVRQILTMRVHGPIVYHYVYAAASDDDWRENMHLITEGAPRIGDKDFGKVIQEAVDDGRVHHFTNCHKEDGDIAISECFINISIDTDD